MIVVFLGAPGTGKGTQAFNLCEQFGFISLSMGALLRKEIEAKSPEGKSAQDVMSKGQLVSDEIVLKILKKNLLELNENQKVILDGYPRNLQQAEDLDNMLKSIGKSIEHVALFDLPFEILSKRILGRYTCNHCQAVYNDFFMKTKKEGVCDHCGSTSFLRRNDDTIEILKSRYDVFEENTLPLVDFYENRNVLKRIDCSGDSLDVFKRLKDTFNVGSIKNKAVL